MKSDNTTPEPSSALSAEEVLESVLTEDPTPIKVEEIFAAMHKYADQQVKAAVEGKDKQIQHWAGLYQKEMEENAENKAALNYWRGEGPIDAKVQSQLSAQQQTIDKLMKENSRIMGEFQKVFIDKKVKFYMSMGYSFKESEEEAKCDWKNFKDEKNIKQDSE